MEKCHPGGKIAVLPVGCTDRTDPSPMTKLTVIPECLLENSAQVTSLREFGMQENVVREPDVIHGNPTSRAVRRSPISNAIEARN